MAGEVASHEDALNEAFETGKATGMERASRLLHGHAAKRFRAGHDGIAKALRDLAWDFEEKAREYRR